tara:strand:- start:1257 stop:1721 length:465 start_codon:yes stop_codon:yes gene_type:complete
MTKKILSHTLSNDEMEALKQEDSPAYLATIDKQGYPRITPLWFLWKGDSFYMTSVDGKPYLQHLMDNPKASICIEIETIQSGIHRPNRQLKALGLVSLYADQSGEITREISSKYLSGDGAEEEIDRRSSVHRTVVKLKPDKIWGLGGGKSLDEN